MIKLDLTHTSGNLTVEDEILNHSSLSFNYTRNSAYQGIFRKYSQDIEVYGVAFDYIKNIYDTFGFDAEINAVVYQYDYTNYAYESVFTGQINLDNYTETHNEDGLNTITTNIEELSFTQKILNDLKVNRNIYELTTDGEELKLNPFPIKKTWSLFNAGEDTIDLAPVLPSSNNGSDTVFQYFTTGGAVDKDVLQEFFSRSFSEGFTFSPLTNSDYLYRPLEVGDHKVGINWDISFESLFDNYDGGTDQDFILNVKCTALVIKWNDSLSLGTQVVVAGTISPVFSADARDRTGVKNWVDSLTATFLVDDLGVDYYVFFQFESVYDLSLIGIASVENRVFFTVNDYSIQFVGATEFPETTHRAFPVYEALDKIIEGSTGNAGDLRSDFFGRTDSAPLSYLVDGDGALSALTSGYLLREQFTLLKSRDLFYSLDQAFINLNAIYNIGMGVVFEGGSSVVRIEEIDYFYQNEIVFIAQDIRGFSKKLATEKYWKSIKVGYQEWQAEDADISGSDEFNSLRQFTLPLANSKSEISIISNFIAATYIIESKRRQRFLAGEDINEQSNLQYDEGTYIIRYIRNGGIIEGETTTTVSNVNNADNVLNVRISPARMIRNHLNVIAGGLINNPTQQINFTSGEGNYKMTSTTDFGAASITEDADITTFPVRLFAPEEYSFEAQMLWSDIQAVAANPYGLIQFINPITNENEAGYIKSLDWNQETNIGSFALMRKENYPLPQDIALVLNGVTGTSVFLGWTFTEPAGGTVIYTIYRGGIVRGTTAFAFMFTDAPVPIGVHKYYITATQDGVDIAISNVIEVTVV
jgi:hypothetical protein